MSCLDHGGDLSGDSETVCSFPSRRAARRACRQGLMIAMHGPTAPAPRWYLTPFLRLPTLTMCTPLGEKVFASTPASRNHNAHLKAAHVTTSITGANVLHQGSTFVSIVPISEPLRCHMVVCYARTNIFCPSQISDSSSSSRMRHCPEDMSRQTSIRMMPSSCSCDFVVFNCSATRSCPLTICCCQYETWNSCNRAAANRGPDPHPITFAFIHTVQRLAIMLLALPFLSFGTNILSLRWPLVLS